MADGMPTTPSAPGTIWAQQPTGSWLQVVPGSTSGGTGIPTNYKGPSASNAFTKYSGAGTTSGSGTQVFGGGDTGGTSSQVSFPSGPAGPFSALQPGLQSGATDLMGAGKTVLNTAMDPRKELYNRTAQQLQDQVRVGEAARGISMSPYGAGVENSAMSNFNIDWQNQQLARQLQGISGASAAMGPGMNLYGMGGQNQQSTTTYPAGYGSGGSSGGDSGGGEQQQPWNLGFTAQAPSMAPSGYSPMPDYAPPPSAPAQSNTQFNWTPPQTNYNAIPSAGASQNLNLSGFGTSTGSAPTMYSLSDNSYSGPSNVSGYNVMGSYTAPSSPSLTSSYGSPPTNSSLSMGEFSDLVNYFMS